MPESRVLEDVAVKWANHSRQEVREMAELLQNQKEVKDKGIGDVTVDMDHVMESSKSVFKPAIQEGPVFNWIPYPHKHASFSDRVLVAHLSEPSSEALLYLFFIPPSECIPQHGIEIGSVVQVLAGADGASIGGTAETLKPVSEDQIFYFPPAAPKVFQAGPDTPLLLLCARSGGMGAKFWYANPDAHVNSFNDVMSIGSDIHKYYLDFAEDYEEVMRAWGYCMPEVTADALVKHSGLGTEDVAAADVLDLGCGDGLTGQALKKKGFNKLTAVDFSENMLKMAEKRGCYKALKQADLLKKLPFEDNSFDLLISTAVTTYINPSVLSDWIRVCRPGGLVVFTHKTLIWAEWEAEQERLAGQGLWAQLWVSEPVPYLPSLKEGGTKTCKEDAKIYIYKKN